MLSDLFGKAETQKIKLNEREDDINYKICYDKITFATNDNNVNDVGTRVKLATNDKFGTCEFC